MPKIKKENSDKKDYDAKLESGFEELSFADKVNVLKHEYFIAAKSTPDYNKLKEELNMYRAELPKNSDIVDFSKINSLYAIGQSYSTRITTIETIAIDNCNNWKRLCNNCKILIKELEWGLEDESAQLLMSDEIKKLSSVRLREAAVRNKLPKLYKKINKLNYNLLKFQSCLSDAEALKEIASIRKKDVMSLLMNLTRQVKVIQTEKNMTGFGD